ncbi:MAG: ABC transporter permease subunit [Eubacterium sp.]|nr:ABC transporter permease subunit [Eubacterium sp.]
MSEFRCLVKKDIKEILRTGKLILFVVLGLGIAVMILAFTALFTDLPDFLEVELPGIDIVSLENMMGTLYPRMVRESLGIFAYYIGIFYSLIIILVSHAVLPNERKNGKWVLPVQQGYTKRTIVTSKCLVYGTLAAASVFVSYLFYYAAAETFMMRNMPFGNAFFLAVIHGLNLFFILCFTMLLSVYFKSSVVAVISVLGTVLFVPDIMNYLPVGIYLPTYMLTFVYESGSDFGLVVGPLLMSIFLLILTYYIVVIKLEKESSSAL